MDQLFDSKCSHKPWLIQINSDIFILAICSAILLGIYDVLKKISLKDNSAFKVLWVANLSGLLFVLPIGYYQNVFSAGQSLNFHWHFAILGKAILVNTSWNLAYFGLKHLPISLASPIRSSAPFWVILGSTVFLGERPSNIQWCGVALILVSYFGFSIIGRKEGFHFHKNPWIFAMIAATLLGAISALYDKHLLSSLKIPYIHLQVWFSIYLFFTQSILLLFIKHKLPKLNFRLTIPLVGILLVVSDILYFKAIQEPDSFISLISPLRRSGVVISFIIGGLLFKESYLGKKVILLFGIIGGIFLIGYFH